MQFFSAKFRSKHDMGIFPLKYFSESSKDMSASHSFKMKRVKSAVDLVLAWIYYYCILHLHNSSSLVSESLNSNYLFRPTFILIHFA